MGIVKIVMWLNKNFTATALKSRCNKRYRKISKKAMILRRFRVFCKFVVLLVVVAFTEYFIPKALKWRCNGRKNETS